MATKVLFQTSLGDFTLELEDEKAPITVANFLQYVDDKHYDGTIFHRVINGFMIQGGGFEPGMKQKTTRPNIQNESSNGLENKRGTIAMARTPDPHSASAQFFINLVDNAFLDKSRAQDGHGYCVFGKVTSGMETIDKIKAVKTGRSAGHSDVPTTDVTVLSATRA